MRSPMKFFCPSLGLLLGAGSEMGQLAGLVPGSFDVIDLFCWPPGRGGGTGPHFS
jgi:hypothetical protein